MTICFAEPLEVSWGVPADGLGDILDKNICIRILFGWVVVVVVMEWWWWLQRVLAKGMLRPSPNDRYLAWSRPAPPKNRAQ